MDNKLLTDLIGEVCRRKLNVETNQDINNWFLKYNADAYEVTNLGKAAELINQSLKTKVFWVCGDYDADGVCATTIMVQTLRRKGANVKFMIPDREEGFGLNCRMVHEIASQDNAADVIIITVDNGTSAFEAIELAKWYKMTVIVTDHHLPSLDDDENVVLPEADIIVNPHVTGDEFDGYCGAGLAYKIARKLLGPECRCMLPLAAIATIGDVVPLREENYVFVRQGIALMKKGFATPGVLALLAGNTLDQRFLDEEDIAFRLVPELNAPGRIGGHRGAFKSVETLCATQDKATALAEELFLLNERRKVLCNEGFERAKQLVENSCLDINNCIVLYMPTTEEGIVGILAGKIAELFNKPCFCLTDSSVAGVIKGSGRSVEGVHMKNTLDLCADLLLAYGGHEGAAGVSLKKENLQEFTARLFAVTPAATKKEEDPEVDFDLQIEADQIALVANEVAKYAPFGEQNPKPVFMIRNFRPASAFGKPYREIGEKGIKFTSRDGDAVSFDQRDQVKQIAPEELANVTLYGVIGMNHFRGRSTPQVIFSKLSA